jgi:hypothetical protein
MPIVAARSCAKATPTVERSIPMRHAQAMQALPRSGSQGPGKVEIERPRLRGFDGKEQPVPSWEAAVAEDWLGKWALNQMWTICYIYLPITAAHSAPTASGYVQYGPNTIGSMSCLAAAPARGAGRPPATTSRPGAGTATPPPRASPSPAPAPAIPDAPAPSR